MGTKRFTYDLIVVSRTLSPRRQSLDQGPMPNDHRRIADSVTEPGIEANGAFRPQRRSPIRWGLDGSNDHALDF